jgi:dolichyl-phosphate-mannose-protein mannosyltransferase
MHLSQIQVTIKKSGKYFKVRSNRSYSKIVFFFSAYGFVDFEGDANDYWRIEMENNSAIEEAGQFLQARRTKFRLRHPNSDCHLYAGFNRLPAWGQDQQEVSCIQEGLKFKTTWMVDETENPLCKCDGRRVKK